MIQEEQFLAQILTAIKQEGPKYSFLLRLLESNTPEAFYEHFISIGEIAQLEATRYPSIETQSVKFFINRKFKKFIDWEKADFQRIMKSCQNLNKTIHLKLMFQLVPQSLPNIFHMFEAIKNTKQTQQDEERIGFFLENNLDALYNEEPNQQTYSYKCLQKMNEQERQEFEILSVNFNRKDDPEKGKNIYEKYIKTDSPRILSLLFKNSYSEIVNAKNQILNLKLLYSQSLCWQLVGDCRANRLCLTPQIMTQCIPSYRFNYRVLAKDLFIQTEDSIIFKFDIYSISFIKQKQFYMKLSKTADLADVEKHFNQLYINTIKLMNGILSNKKIMMFNVNKAHQIPSEKIEEILQFCLKLLTYPFRVRYSNNIETRDKLGGQSNIKFEIPAADLKKVFCKLIEKMLIEQSKSNLKIINTLSEVFRWIDQTHIYEQTIKQFFLEKCHQYNLKTLFLQLLKKIINSKVQVQLPYHLSCWIIRYISFEENLKQTANQFHQILLRTVYQVLLNTKHFLVYNYQLRKCNHLSIPSIHFLPKTIDKIIIQNPQFSPIIYNLWVKELQYFQSDHNYQQSNRSNRLFMLVYIYNIQQFPVTEKIKERARELININDFKHIISLNPLQRPIWQKFISKIDLDSYQIIDNCLHELSKYKNDQNLLLNNYKNHWYKYQIPQNLSHFYQYFAKLSFFSRMVEPTNQQIMKLYDLVFKLNFTTVLYKQHVQNIAAECSDEQLQWLSEVANNGFSDCLQQQFQHHYYRIKSSLEKDKDIVTRNKSIIYMEAYLKLIIEKYQNPTLVYEFLDLIIDTIRCRAKESQCSLLQQFYYYHRHLIIQLLQKLLTHYQFDFKSKKEYPYGISCEYSLASKAKKQGKSVRQERNNVTVLMLEYRVKHFITTIFTIQQWESSILINNIMYMNINSFYRLKQSIRYDLTKILIKRFSPEKVSMNLKLYQIIQKEQVKDAQKYSYETKKIDQIQQCLKPFIFFQDQSQCKKMIVEASIAFIQKIFEFSHQQTDFWKLKLFLKLLKWPLDKKQEQQLNRELLLKLFSDLKQILPSVNFNWIKYRNIHSYIRIIIQVYQQPIGQLLSKEMLQKYLPQLLLDLQNNIFSNHSPLPFMRLIERLMPYSQPQYIDENFKKFVNTVVFIYRNLLKYVKLSKAMPYMKTFMNKAILFNNWGLLQSEVFVEIFQFVTQMENGSQLFCSMVKKQLQLASIQLQVKCYFLKYLEKNQMDTRKRVKLQSFAEVLSQKHKNNKQNFIRVVERIARKQIIKQQNQNVTYLLLGPQQSFEFSTFYNKEFADMTFSQGIKQIVPIMINKINSESDPADIMSIIKEIRIIAYNYPILIAYIMMHPCQDDGNDKIPFVDYFFKTITTIILEEEVYESFAYLCVDLTSIFKFEGETIFFSQYLCYRLMKNIMRGELTSGVLLFTFYMTKVKKFSDMCFKKDDEDKSLCNRLWERLRQSRQNFNFQRFKNIIIYSTLSLIYRQNSLSSIQRYWQYDKRDASQWTSMNGFINQCWIPFNNVVLKENVKQGTIFQINKDYEFKNKKSYIQFEKSYGKWYQSQTNENNSINQKKLAIQILLDQPIIIKDQFFKNIGAIIEPKIQKFSDIESNLNLSYDRRHRSLFQGFHLYFSSHAESVRIENRRFRNRNNEYSLYEFLPDNAQNGNQESNKQLEDYFNIHRQSRYAPQQFRHETFHHQKENNKIIDDFKKQLEQIVPLIEQKHQLINQNQARQITQQMVNLLNYINQRLVLLAQQQLCLDDIQGKSSQQSLQSLRLKELEVDFDYHLAILSDEQFHHFCLTNAAKLGQLDKQRRNIISNIENFAIHKLVSKSHSSDAGDYIIDIIDENYQFLGCKHPFIIQQHPSIQKPKKKVNIHTSMLPLQVFQDISDDNLYEIILSVYYSSKLIPIDYFVPFIENKKVQDKIINMLLYIYRNPFQNPHFPNLAFNYDFKEQKWVFSEVALNDVQEMKAKIIKIFENGLILPFYEEDNYLNKEIKHSIIKGQQYDVNNQEKYRPIFKIFDLMIDKNIQQFSSKQCQSMLRLFQGVIQISDDHIQKLLILLKQIYRILQEDNINQYQMDSNNIQIKVFQKKAFNFQRHIFGLLKYKKVKQSIRQAFPIQQEGRNTFFICLLLESNIYQRQQILKFHRHIIQKDQEKSGNVYFANLCFKHYSIQELKQCFWLKQSKNIVPSMIKALPKYNTMLKQQPFYKICQFPQLTTLQFKTQVLCRRVFDYKKQFTYHGKSDIVAQRKKGIFQSAFLDLKNKPDGFWYEDFSVKFMNQQDQLESGYGNGVAKDWYSLVTKGMVNLNYGIFMKTSKNCYFFNRQSWINPRHLQFLEFIGKIFAIAIVHKSFYMVPSFSILLYKMILGEQIEMGDIIKEFDEGEVIKNVQKLRDIEDNSLVCDTFVYEDKRLIAKQNIDSILKRKGEGEQTAENNMKGSRLYFIHEKVEVINESSQPSSTAQMPIQYKQQRMMQEESQTNLANIIKIGEAIELIPGGANIPVTIQNREQFITLTKQKIFDIIVQEIKPQFNAFMNGFRRIVKPQFLQGISAEDLRQIAQGCDKISIDDLKFNVSVDKEVKQSPYIVWFWDCLSQLSAQDKMHLIQHWTGLPKIPAEGFNGIKLKIVKGSYKQRLYAQTCFNQLHMPQVQSKQKMEEAILMAINSIKIGGSIIED